MFILALALLFVPHMLYAGAGAYDTGKEGCACTIVAGDTCAAVKEDGSLWMWGVNTYGEIGNGYKGNHYNTNDFPIPIAPYLSVPEQICDHVISVSVGHEHTAVIKDDNSLWVWGSNHYGQLGNGGMGNYEATADWGSEPVQTVPLKIMEDVVSVSAGAFCTAAVKKDGSLWTWGNDDRGLLGNGPEGSSFTPVKIMDDVVAVSLGWDTGAAIKSDGTLWMWGCNEYGKLGDGFKGEIPPDDAFPCQSTPVRITDNVSSVSCGTNHTVCIKKDGSLWAWGNNRNGQLGNSAVANVYKDGWVRPLQGEPYYYPTAYQTTPAKIMDGVLFANAGYDSTAIVKDDNSLWICGNKYGYGAKATNDPNSNPIYSIPLADAKEPIQIMDHVLSASLGMDFHSSIAVLKDDGTMWMWGDNTYGSLGSDLPGNLTYEAPGRNGVYERNVQTIPVQVMDHVRCDSAISTGGHLEVYTDYPMNYISVNKFADYYVGYFVGDDLDETQQDFSIVISDESVAGVFVDKWYSGQGRLATVFAHKPGHVTVTFTNPATGDSRAIALNVVDSDSVYNFDTVPKRYLEERKDKSGKKVPVETNWDNYFGLFVDNFTSVPHKGPDGKVDYYTVSMNVFNRLNLYGSAVSYDKHGNMHQYRVIEPMKDNPESIIEIGSDLYYKTGDLLHQLKNIDYYSGQGISKETTVELEVPADGYLCLSNNVEQSPVALTANVIGFALECATAADSAIDASGIINIEPIVKKVLVELGSEGIDAVMDGFLEVYRGGKVDFKDFGGFLAEMLDRLKDVDIDLIAEMRDAAPAVGESVFLDILPTGVEIKTMLISLKALNISFQWQWITKSVDFSNGIFVYAPPTDQEYHSNGVMVNPSSQGYDPKTVVRAFVVSDADDSAALLDSLSSREKQGDIVSETYSITMYQDGERIQPNSKVQVRIPLSEGLRQTDWSKIRVYRRNDDSSFTDMNAFISDGYAIFSTDHFSYYTVLFNSSFSSTNLKNIFNNRILLIGLSVAVCMITILLLFTKKIRKKYVVHPD